MDNALLGKNPEVCDALGISRPTLRAMVIRGELPVVRVGPTVGGLGSDGPTSMNGSPVRQSPLPALTPT
jgi:hypothetical protein